MSETTIVTIPEGGVEIHVSRRLAAPPDLVFRAYTEAEHLRHWWGPARFELVSCEIDLRVGGGYRFVQLGADGAEYAFHGEYLEIAPPGKLVQTFVFEGMPDDVTVETLVLEADGDGTLMRATSVFPSREALDGAVRSGMLDGMRETYERLVAHLTTERATA